MKAAHIPVLGVALAAGGAAAFLSGGDESKQREARSAAQLKAIDAPIAIIDIAMSDIDTMRFGVSTR